MNIKRGIDGRYYAVFADEDSATRWAWLFAKVLRRDWASFGGFFNAFRLI